MPVEKIDLEKFLKLSQKVPILDVRSPLEFKHAHIPGAYSVPIFTDEQRGIIGTAYKKEGRPVAVDIGLGFFSESMKTITAEAINISKDYAISPSENKEFLIHCWRGGMRSDAVAWLLSLYGYKIYVLTGGYKTFRSWALSQFEKKYSLKILGGYTGSGKTDILKELKRKGMAVIDLEYLANHKGSAFGSLGEKPQPTSEMFENLLAIELLKIQNIGEKYPINNIKEIWIEDESVHIGTVGIPKTFWQQMRNSPLFFLDIPFEERVNYIVNNYGLFDKQDLTACILKIQKRLGGLYTKNAINFLQENNLKDTFSILLKYYDKLYSKSLNNRDNLQAFLNKVTCTKVENSNAEKLIIQ